MFGRRRKRRVAKQQASSIYVRQPSINDPRSPNWTVSPNNYNSLPNIHHRNFKKFMNR
jgi:hypothetical protein